MPSQEKVEKVEELSDKLSRAKSVVLTDYRGLTVSQLEDFRKKIEAVGAEYQITKNTLLSRSLKGTEVPKEVMEGPIATLFSFADEIAPLKVLQEFIKVNGLPSVKVGYLGGALLTAEQVSELAKLPGRDVLLGRLVGSLKGNQYALVSVLSGNIRKLVYGLSAIASSKS